MRAGAFRTGVVAASLFLPFVVVAGVQAQTPSSAAPNAPSVQAPPQPKPVTGFVSSYEILRTARAAGFDPLAPPLRDGTTYVLRATDYRGILMRVVFDARTGAIRDANRIIPADSDYRYGMTPPPYGPSPYAAPAYGPPPYVPAPYGASGEYRTPAQSAPAREGAPTPLIRPGTASTKVPVIATHPASPPLPRPRPAALGPKSQKTGMAKPVGGLAQSAASQPQSGGASAHAVSGSATSAPVAAPSKTPPPLTSFND